MPYHEDETPAVRQDDLQLHMGGEPTTAADPNIIIMCFICSRGSRSLRYTKHIHFYVVHVFVFVRACLLLGCLAGRTCSWEHQKEARHIFKVCLPNDIPGVSWHTKNAPPCCMQRRHDDAAADLLSCFLLACLHSHKHTLTKALPATHMCKTFTAAGPSTTPPPAPPPPQNNSAANPVPIFFNASVTRTNGSLAQLVVAAAPDAITSLQIPAGSFAEAVREAPVVQLTQSTILASTVQPGLKAVSRVLQIRLDPPVPIIKVVVVTLRGLAPSSSSSSVASGRRRRRRMLLQQQQDDGNSAGSSVTSVSSSLIC